MAHVRHAVALQADLGSRLEAYLVDLVPRAIDFALQVAVFLVTLAVVYLVGKALVVPLARGTLDARGVEETIARPALKLVGAAVLVVAFAVALAAAGFGSLLVAVGTLAAALTLAVGFASQDVLANLVAGVFMISDPKLKIGDWIEWDDEAGVIEDISFRVTRVRTFDNELVTVPNSELTTTAVTNPVATDRLRTTFTFGIGYDDDIDRAREIIVEAARDHPEVLDEPAPSVRLTELGDSAVGLQSRIWVGDPARGDVVRVKSEHVQAVKERFDAEGVDMPYPYTELTGGVDVDLEGADEAPTGVGADD